MFSFQEASDYSLLSVSGTTLSNKTNYSLIEIGLNLTFRENAAKIADMTTMETVTVKKARAIPFYNEAPLDVLPERVFVYRNLAKERATGETYYSVKNTRTGLIVAHVKNIALNNVTFVVQPAGRAKVLREKQKTVHAGLRGTPVKLDNSVQVEAGTYNPYKSETFVSRADLTPLTTAPYAHLDSNGVWFSV